MKKIVLLSDGTGNGAAKRHKTNVRRLYDALDLHRGNQIAMYDDGVGSQEFLLFRLLGGAFGWGLKRNVMELYKFLCRNYTPGDRIYCFGFSRGAFTLRVLVGLIDHCGLCTEFATERELHGIARANYSIYREKHKGLRLARLLPRIRDRALLRDRSRLETATRPCIEFVGAWDTVEAYGLPVKELADRWDQFIFAMRFRDRELSSLVRRACHALSIDDERHTFHPVLWDESEERNPGRVEQVWFPGAHSDVGGGYPRSELALVSLDWMISKVEATDGDDTGLVFLDDLRREYRYRRDWNGIQHDSRAGLRAFYRYKPRDVEELCMGAGAKADKAGLPKIHRSAFERIREKVVPYAPTGLPAQYCVVTTRSAVPVFETSEEAAARRSAMDGALDIVYWRRWLYRAFLATTLALVASPVLLEWEAATTCSGAGCLLGPVCGFARTVLPDFAAGWVSAWCQNPEWFAFLLFFYVTLSVLKRWAAAGTFERAALAWSAPTAANEPSARNATTTSRLRAISAGAIGRVAGKARWSLAFSIILVAIFVAADRTAFHIRDSMGELCKGSDALTTATGRTTVTFDAAEPCMPAGVELVPGTTYGFDIEPSSDWMDGGLAAGPEGLPNVAPMKMQAFTPFRRHLSRPWFELTGRVGRPGGDTFAIGSGTCYTAKSGGPLYLYVNDAVSGLMPGRWWAFPYFWSIGANRGTATITVTAVERSLQCVEADR